MPALGAFNHEYRHENKNYLRAHKWQPKCHYNVNLTSNNTKELLVGHAVNKHRFIGVKFLLFTTFFDTVANKTVNILKYSVKQSTRSGTTKGQS